MTEKFGLGQFGLRSSGNYAQSDIYACDGTTLEHLQMLLKTSKNSMPDLPNLPNFPI